jgi:hypothetical protein
MSLLSYIQGFHKGKEAHRLEREAMQDPFLSDAIDGYTRVKGDHAKQIENLQKRITLLSRTKNNSIRIWSVAASILIIISLGAYFFTYKLSSPPELVAQYETQPAETILKESEPAAESTHIELAPQQLANNTIVKKSSPLQTPPIVVQNESVVTDELMEMEVSKQSELAQPEIADLKDVELKNIENENSLAEAVVVGYGKTNKKVITGATSTVKAETLSQMPQPVIGNKAYKKYLKKELQHFVVEDCEQKHGKVILVFHVNDKGRPFDIQVMQSLCPSADKEAIRLVEKGADWTMGDKEVKMKIKF